MKTISEQAIELSNKTKQWIERGFNRNEALNLAYEEMDFNEKQSEPSIEKGNNDSLPIIAP